MVKGLLKFVLAASAIGVAWLGTTQFLENLESRVVSHPLAANENGLTFSAYFGEKDPYERMEEGVVLEGPTEAFNGSMELVMFRPSAQPAPYYDAALVAKADRIKPGERIRCRAARIYVNHGARGWQHVFGCERAAQSR